MSRWQGYVCDAIKNFLHRFKYYIHLRILLGKFSQLSDGWVSPNTSINKHLSDILDRKTNTASFRAIARLGQTRGETFQKNCHSYQIETNRGFPLSTGEKRGLITRETHSSRKSSFGGILNSRWSTKFIENDLSSTGFAIVLMIILGLNNEHILSLTCRRCDTNLESLANALDLFPGFKAMMR